MQVNAAMDVGAGRHIVPVRRGDDLEGRPYIGFNHFIIAVHRDNITEVGERGLSWSVPGEVHPEKGRSFWKKVGAAPLVVEGVRGLPITVPRNSPPLTGPFKVGPHSERFGQG